MTVYVRTIPNVFEGEYKAIKLIHYRPTVIKQGDKYIIKCPHRFVKEGEVILFLDKNLAIIKGKYFDSVFYFHSVKLYKVDKNGFDRNGNKKVDRRKTKREN